MPKISLCMVVKSDVESLKNFWHCVESVGEYVDEIVVATERPPDIKEASPAVQWHKYKWKDDFADARNFSFSKASNDIILWCDSDDTLEHPEKLEEVAQLIEDGKLDWAWFEYIYETDEQGNILMRQWQPRLIRKGTGHWEMPIHESFVPDKEITQTMYDTTKVIHHTDEAHRMEHGKRNLKILLADYQKHGIKTDPRILYYLGNTLLATERFEEAIPFYHMHIEQCGWPEEKYFSLHYLSQTYFYLGQLEAAINMAMEATKIFPVWNLAYFDIAQYYSAKADTGSDKLDYKRAIEWTIIGLTKQKPDSKGYFTNDLDYSKNPMGRLAEAYIQTHEFDRAYDIAKRLHQDFPKDKELSELYKDAKELVETEEFVASFITVGNKIGDTDRIKGAKLFDALPGKFDEDYRIQALRQNLVPPKTWEPKSIVIYCHGGLEEWGPPSIYTGLGGSETAVIKMGEELTKLGYKVTVYNRCGDYRGTYKGVEYRPYYHFDTRDNFDTLIVWRYPAFMGEHLKAKRKYLWLHDIVGPNLFNERIIKNVDKVFFLSKWHRNNLPELPEEKVFITNNGIDPTLFEGEYKKRPNSLVWTSSYDRGLLPFLKNIYPLIQKEIPEVTLDVCYGWNNIEKEMHAFPYLKQLREELEIELNKPSITHHGRLGHKQVVELLKSSMVMPYASEFGETNNISSQQAQAAGVYVITTSQAGGTSERLEHGGLIKGNGIYTDKELQKEFAEAVIDFFKHPNKYDAVATLESINVKEKFSWETTAKQWDKELLNGTN